MTTRPLDTPHCDASVGCITCSDAADAMRIETLSDDRSLGTCIDEQGRAMDVMLALVPEADVGDVVLVHAGVALQTLARGVAE